MEKRCVKIIQYKLYLRVKSKYIFALMLLFMPINLAFSEEKIKEFSACQIYTDFLSGKVVQTPVSGCDKITEFILNNHKLDRVNFSIEYNKFVSENSPMKATTTGLYFVVFRDSAKAYANLEVAQTLMYSSFSSIGDDLRAQVYSLLIREIKKEAVRLNLKSDSNLLDFVPSKNLVESFGSDFERVDAVRADKALMCLIKIDNLATNFNEVINSEQLKTCLK